MTSGPTSSLARNARMRSPCCGSTLGARHMRGLDEKIWKVLAPISRACSTAFEAPPVVPRCTPIRFVMGTVYKAVRAAAALRRIYVEALAQGAKRCIDAVDLSGMAQVREAVHFLFRGAETPRQIDGTDFLAQHLVQQENLGRDAW